MGSKLIKQLNLCIRFLAKKCIFFLSFFFFLPKSIIRVGPKNKVGLGNLKHFFGFNPCPAE